MVLAAIPLANWDRVTTNSEMGKAIQDNFRSKTKLGLKEESRSLFKVHLPDCLQTHPSLHQITSAQSELRLLKKRIRKLLALPNGSLKHTADGMPAEC